MSCWWDYDVVAYGNRDKLIELEKALPELTYETVSGDQATVFHRIRELENHFGFLAIHASRNYGADSPLCGLCQRFPMLTFGGRYYNDMIHPEMHWTFEARGGVLVVQEHVDNESDWDRTMTADEVKADIKKRATKIETLQEELSDLKYYLVRHHHDQIGDALLDHEITAISAHIDAEDKEATARRTAEAIPEISRAIAEARRAQAAV